MTVQQESEKFVAKFMNSIHELEEDYKNLTSAEKQQADAQIIAYLKAHGLTRLLEALMSGSQNTCR